MVSETTNAYLSIDLEVGRQDDHIHQFAGICSETRQSLSFRQGDLLQALEKLDRLAESAHSILGHNIIAFDFPHLASANPQLKLLQKPVVDTLRLNPLAFPRNPYHHLVKHYQDGQLQRCRRNDPLLDSELALEILANQRQAFNTLYSESPALLLIWHWLATRDNHCAGFDRFFSEARQGQSRPDEETAKAAIRAFLQDKGCRTVSQQLAQDAEKIAWPLAYALAWLSVAGGNSVLPPWVRYQFPETVHLIRALRDTPCDDPGCEWCREQHDAEKLLKFWFGSKLQSFRPEPKHKDGRPLQQVIVETALRGEPVLGILPTGTGKSLCYQIPALSRFHKTGALTVVISPLVALMEDQVKSLRDRNIQCCAAINGLLSMPERSDVLDRVRLGDVGILLIAPEQLRNRTVRKVLAQREIGGWVMDEAHCLSKWGQDFRPDYRYVGRFIRERAGKEAIPPIQCLTATAKPDVIDEIVDHFRKELGVELKVLDGGANRKNLDFAVLPTTSAEKFAQVHALIAHDLPEDMPGGAIVYCATRKQTEEMADFLRQKGWTAACYHARLPPETKKETQAAFIAGTIRVIAATNAFGMGIDKPDVRLVVHADIPGSLENYLQEAGRAGRDEQTARCVLLYAEDDVNRQHSMSSGSRLSRKDIQTILMALRRLSHRKSRDGELVATSGEILAEDDDGAFERDSATDDTRVRTAVSWLEEASLLTREENFVQIFPSSLQVASLDEAKKRLERKVTDAGQRAKLLGLVACLIASPADVGISTDELMTQAGLSPEELRAALHDLQTLGVSSNDTEMTAFLHVGVERSSKKRLEEAVALERAMIHTLRENSPDVGKGERYPLHLRILAQQLKDQGYSQAIPERLRQLLCGIAGDGRGEENGTASLTLHRSNDADCPNVSLQREWSALEKTADLRRAAAALLLQHWLNCLPAGSKGVDQLARTTLGKLCAALEADALLVGSVKNGDVRKLQERALLWLHEQEIIRLNKGLAVFRPAMTLRLNPDWKQNFKENNYKPLHMHYDELTRQIHIMTEYAERGIKLMREALDLVGDYFRLPREDFFRLWLPGRDQELLRQTTPQSWNAIVESLDKPAQRNIVADDRENTNVLVLAGPGSGKTRVLVHRIAYLVRVRRENPRAVLALAYNRHAAAQIRERLQNLIGDDARGVTVMTCHALAMRIVGASFSGKVAKTEDKAIFDHILREAVALLNGANLPAEEADEQRDRLLAGFRWILVDEYQDIGAEQYALISALAGRSRSDEDGRLNLFAVGDDDQNIYAFAGASVEYIRRFEADYKAKPVFLIENYRSTRHIIEAANLLIDGASERMKQEHPICINRARARQAPGGLWQSIDPVTQGRVQILPAGNSPQSQALAVIAEIQRLRERDAGFHPDRCAVIAREWKFLDPLRAACEHYGIPVQMADEKPPPLWRLRETQTCLDWLKTKRQPLVCTALLLKWLAEQTPGIFLDLLGEAIKEYGAETHDQEMPVAHFVEWLAEWGRDFRQRQSGVLLLTAHRAKGLEFEHVIVLDGNWQPKADEESDALRRLYYVAMTRAQQTLTLARMQAGNWLLDGLPESRHLLKRSVTALPEPFAELQHRYLYPDLSQIDLGFAGRKTDSDRVHAAIRRLAPGSRLQLFKSNQRWELHDVDGFCVGRLIEQFSPPAGLRCIQASVRAVIVWRREDSPAEYQDRVRSERWEVVLPELVFAP